MRVDAFGYDLEQAVVSEIYAKHPWKSHGIREGERPTSDYSAEEITYARALDWLRVDEHGFGYISSEGVAAIDVARKRAPFASNAKPVSRCEITSNPCGTDTWFVGHPCQCAPCRALVVSATADDTQPMSAIELESKDLISEPDPWRPK
jgi:hypothetical protein